MYLAHLAEWQPNLPVGFGGITKLDMWATDEVSAVVAQIDFPSGFQGGEPFFVPDSHADKDGKGGEVPCRTTSRCIVRPSQNWIIRTNSPLMMHHILLAAIYYLLVPWMARDGVSAADSVILQLTECSGQLRLQTCTVSHAPNAS